MRVSKAIVPLLKGEAAVSIQKTLMAAQIKPYDRLERDVTIKSIELALSKRKNKKCLSS